MRISRTIRTAVILLAGLSFAAPPVEAALTPASAPASAPALLMPAPSLAFHDLFQNQKGVIVSVRAGFGDSGSYMMGEWFPVRVTLDNPASGSNLRVRAEVSLSGNSSNTGGIYARDLDLPASSHKQITLYTYSSDFNHSIEVRVLQGEQMIARATAAIDPIQPDSGSIIGVVSPDSSLLNIYKGEPVGHPETAPTSNQYGGGPPQPNNGEGAQATVAHISPDDIPALSVALNGLGGLVFDDVDTAALAQEQRDAVASWVGSGGTLIVTSRPGGADTLAGFGDLLPITHAGGTRTLGGLQALSGLVAMPITPTTSIIVPDARLKTEPEVDGRALAQQDGVPLVAMRDLGEGQVVYMALSPGADPLKTWDGTVPLLRRVLAEHALRPSFGAARRNGYYGYGSTQVFDFYGSIFELPGLQLPSPLILALFIFVYILLVGPVNYLVLKRMRRTELAWITIPATVALFSIGAYLVGYQAKGGELVAVRANVLHTEPGLAKAAARQFLGLFSPTRNTYSIEVGTDAAATEVNPDSYGGSPSSRPAVVLAGGAGTRIEGINVNTWSQRSFMAESSLAAQSPLEVKLHLGNNTIEGTVTNRSGSALQDVALLRGRAVQQIGYLAPGQQAPVKIEVVAAAYVAGSPVDLLPLPPGVQDPTQGNNLNYIVGFGSSKETSNEQRSYNRRVQLLNMELGSLLTDVQPEDMSVLSVAWGAPPTTDFRVMQNVRNEDMSLWTGRHLVTGEGQGGGSLNKGSTPVSLYSPGKNPSWRPLDITDIPLEPYADLLYKLPPGTQPQNLTVRYQVSDRSKSEPVELQGYNRRTGEWDRLMRMRTMPQGGDFSIPNPADYTAPGGDVTLRLVHEPGGTASAIGFSTLDLLLNSAP